MTKNRHNIQTISSIWTVKKVARVLKCGLKLFEKLVVNSIEKQMSKNIANKHIYNEISSQLIVENKCSKYTFYIYKFCNFSTSNNLKAGATLYILQQKK